MKFQVWLRGSDLHDVEANNEAEARGIIRDFYGYKKLPKGTYVCKIPTDYYDKIVKNNREIGINAGNI